jgi:chitodextrinase
MRRTHQRASRRALVIMIGVLGIVFVSSSSASAAKPPKPTTTTTVALDRQAPTTPTNLRVTGVTKTSASLAWDPSTDNGSFSYVVRQDNSQSWTVNSTQTSYTLDWLSPGRTYSFSVYAVDNQLNVSGSSNTVTATTDADLTPPSVPVLSVPNVSPSQIWLSWTESIDDLRYSFVDYRIFVNGALATNVNWINHREASVRHLTPSTGYTVKVVARDSAGNTAESNSVSVTTLASTDAVPPSAPTNVRVESDEGCGEVWLAWDQSTDNVDPQSALEYEIIINGVLSPLGVVTGVGRAFAYSTVNGTNRFVVQAVDRTGNTSAPSNVATAELWIC